MAAGLVHSLKRHGLLLAALLATLAVYAQVAGFAPISWDDPEMVFANKDVRAFDLGAFFTGHYVGNYLPLTMVVHAATWALFGNNEAAHHLLNLLLHLVNAVLLYRLSLLLFKNVQYAIIAAIVFLLHPLQVESVAWISELKNLLFTFFFLLGLHLYYKYLHQPSVKLYLLCLLMFVFSCLSKPSAVVFPFALLGIDFIVLPGRWRGLLRNKWPFLVIAVLFGLVNLYAQSEDRFINYAHAFPLPERLGLAGYALLKYAQLFVFPAKLSVIYPYPQPSAGILTAGYITLLLCAGALVIFYRKKLFVVFGSLLFTLINLVLVLQLVPFGEALYADRYMYLAIPGFAWLFSKIILPLKIDVRFLATGLLIVLSLLSYSRANKWQSAIVLYEDILEKYPDNFVALNSAGVESMRADNDRKAMEYFMRATKTAPYNYKGHYNMGLLLLKQQMPERAIQKFNDCLALYDYSKAYNGRATAYYIKGDLSRAIFDAEKAGTLDPSNAKSYYVLGNCYNDMNKLQLALKAFNRAIELEPNDAGFYFKRGIVWGKMQNFRNCKADLELTIHMNSENYEAYYWLGVAKANLGENPCPDLQTAARRNFEPAVKAAKKMCR